MFCTVSSVLSSASHSEVVVAVNQISGIGG